MTTPSGGDVPSSRQGPAPSQQGPAPYPGSTPASEHVTTNVTTAYPTHIGAHIHNIEGRQNRKHGHKHTPGE